MSTLTSDKKAKFNDFISWRKEGNRFMSRRIINLAHLVLFGSFHKENHETRDVCGTYDECKNCDMFKHSRCHEYVKKSYSAYPSTMRDIMKTDYARADYRFYQRAKLVIEHNMTELCLAVGTYRIELFLEEAYEKAVESVALHNKINPNDKFNILESKPPKYHSAEYIQENDIWLMFEETQAQGDILCSLLSDF